MPNRFEFNLEKPVIVCPGKLISEGKRKRLDFAFDTGATYTMIPWSAAFAAVNR